MSSSKPRISPGAIPEHLLQKYTKSGPRYTSYPTAPHFQTEFDADQIRSLWRNSVKSDPHPASLYIHLPFCRTRCLYCGCTTEIGHAPLTMNNYVGALTTEMQRIRFLCDAELEIHQLAIGGGTPTALPKNFMRSMINALTAHFIFAQDAERSIEVDPRTVDIGYLDLLIKAGFNRFSFGVQDLDPEVQSNIMRVLKEDHLTTLLAHLRNSGIEAINLDLMYGLPGQTSDSFLKTINAIAKMAPSRIAVFGYAHVPWMSPHQKALEKFELPTPDQRMTLFGLAFDHLLDAGYAHVGMDHFALPNDELITALNARSLTRNFMGYTTRRGLDLIGIGASAISAVGATYTQNVKKVDEYLKRIHTNSWFKALTLSPEDLLRREIITELFCNFYLDIRTIEDRFKLDNFSKHFSDELKKLQPFQDDALISLTEESLSATDLGRFFIRNICMTFDAYLEQGQARYSKTI